MRTIWIAVLIALLVGPTGCDKKQEASSSEPAAERQAEAESEPQSEVVDQAASKDKEPGATQTDDEQPSNAERALSDAEVDPALLAPSKFSDKAPPTFKAKFETTEGNFVIEFHREWAPNGADRAYNLIKRGYYDGMPFFRVMKGFMAQFGIHADPRVNEAWKDATIPADPVVKSNTRAFVTFAQRADPKTRKSDPSTRTTHMFINYTDNSALDADGFVPVGKVIEGMEVVDNLYSGYGGGPPSGPHQGLAMKKGGEYFAENFPRLDWIIDAEVVENQADAD